MTFLYPAIEPHARGMLDVGGDDRVYWESCGNPNGKPAVVLHGGPGSGCTPWHRKLFNPAAYRIVLLDQRGCGRSTPHASAPDADLSGNHTRNLVADIERLRAHLNIERWLILGGSWGSTLALAYAEQYPDRVTQIVLWGVTTGRWKEFDWWFRGGAGTSLFPEQWRRLCAALAPGDRDGDVAEGYQRMLFDSDPAVRRSAALAWCRWESSAPGRPPDALSGRFADPDFALAFARLVTHYVRHNAWLEDGQLLRDVRRLAEIPAILISGRQDFQAPIEWAWDLHRAWPRSTLTLVDNAGHDGSETGIARELVRATDRFAND